MGSTPENLAGCRFSRLHVLHQEGRTKHGSVKWACECSCGNSTIVAASDLKKGHTVSCGCQRREAAASLHRTHGESKRTPEYRVWSAMKQRVLNPNCNSFKNYGGRGITICQRWVEYENFLVDMGRRPSPKHTIERRDNDGPYSPDNCYWELKEKQARNKRNTRLLTHDGETRVVSEWEKITGIRSRTILNRIDKLGWSVEKTLTTPTRPWGR